MLSNTLETTNSQSQVLNTVVVGACDGSEAQSVYKQRQKEKADQANLNLWQHPFVDVLKHFKVLPGNDWRLNLKKGDVSEYFVSLAFVVSLIFVLFLRPRRSADAVSTSKAPSQPTTSSRSRTLSATSSPWGSLEDTYTSRSRAKDMVFHSATTSTLGSLRGPTASESQSATSSRSLTLRMASWPRYPSI